MTEETNTPEPEQPAETGQRAETAAAGGDAADAAGAAEATDAASATGTSDSAESPASGDLPDTAGSPSPTDSPDSPILDPAKVIRMGHVCNKLLEELKGVELDPAGRKRLARIHLDTVERLRAAVGEELRAELESLTPALSSRSTPSQSELTVAQVCLVGWLDGLAMSLPHVFVPKQAVAIDQNGAGIIIGAPGGTRSQASAGAPADTPENSDGHAQGNYL